jgi:hypothetical protein
MSEKTTIPAIWDDYLKCWVPQGTQTRFTDAHQEMVETRLRTIEERLARIQDQLNVIHNELLQQRSGAQQFPNLAYK